MSHDFDFYALNIAKIDENQAKHSVNFQYPVFCYPVYSVKIQKWNQQRAFKVLKCTVNLHIEKRV